VLLPLFLEEVRGVLRTRVVETGVEVGWTPTPRAHRIAQLCARVALSRYEFEETPEKFGLFVACSRSTAPVHGDALAGVAAYKSRIRANLCSFFDPVNFRRGDRSAGFDFPLNQEFPEHGQTMWGQVHRLEIANRCSSGLPYPTRTIVCSLVLFARETPAKCADSA
jgi:hypothetical protein